MLLQQHAKTRLLSLRFIFHFLFRKYVFYDCAERKRCGMVDAEIRVLQAELFAGKMFLV